MTRSMGFVRPIVGLVSSPGRCGLFFRLPRLAVGVLLAALSVLPAAFADTSFIAKAAIGNKSSELIIRDRSFTPDFITLDLALTGTLNNFFVTLDNDVSIKDDIETDPNGLIFFSRQDINLTFGYSFKLFSVFTGWRVGETDAFYTGQNNSFGTTSEGYYLGASSSYTFDKTGTLYGSVAIADLDGEVSLTEPLVDTSAFVLGTAPANIQGSSVGFSAAIGWSGEVSANTTYNIEYKINQFDFEDDVKFGGLDLSYEENFQTLYFGLTHFF